MKALKTIFIIVLFVVTGVIIAVFAGRRFGFFGGAAVVSTSDSVSIKKFSNIELEADALNFKIEEGDDYHVEYTCPSNMIPTARVNGDTLKITSKASGGVSFFNFKDYTEKDFSLTVFVPKGTTEFGDLDVKINAGNMILEGYTFKDITAELDAGNLELKDVTASDLDLKVDAGRVAIEGGKFDNVTIDADAGDIEIDDTEMKDVSVNADMGNIKLKNVVFENGIANADLGKISVSGTFEKLEGESSMGDIDVENKNGDAKYDLNVDMGKITVDGSGKGNSYQVQ